jgi:hypothetical protein
MSAQNPQPIEPVDFIDFEDYTFGGNSGTVANKRRFLEGIRLKASVYHAAQYASVGRTTVYRWLQEDAEFAQAVSDATEDAGDKLESSVYERAFRDNLLAMFWLKAHRPKFRDKVTVDVDDLREQIQEKMSRMDVDRLRQLPAATTQFVDTDTVQSRDTQSMHFASLPSDLQKE